MMNDVVERGGTLGEEVQGSNLQKELRPAASSMWRPLQFIPKEVASNGGKERRRAEDEEGRRRTTMSSWNHTAIQWTATLTWSRRLQVDYLFEAAHRRYCFS